MPNIVKQFRYVVAMALSVTCSYALLSNTHAAPTNDVLPVVEIRTSQGNIQLTLRPDAAPKTVENFLQYARDGFYRGTIFHRVIPGFMIQGGGFTESLDRKDTRDPIINEARQTMSNLRGTIAMARTPSPNSATSQFFINLVDNQPLDAGARGAGYAVFGKVTGGMGVVDAIAGLPTTTRYSFKDVPVEPVVIQDVVILASPPGTAK